MLTHRLIPCLDVADGRVKKGIRFQNLRDAGDPVERATVYQAQGADELVVLDISATPAGRGHQLDVIRNLRRVLMMPLTAGGGVRTLDDVEALLTAGADKVAINTAAVAEPSLLNSISQRFGRQCTVLAVDAQKKASSWQVMVRSGKEATGRDVLSWVAQATDRGAGEILLTSWDRDGTGEGYDLELLRAVRQNTSVPIIASGGAAHVEHLREAFLAGADAVLAATIFHDENQHIAGLKANLQASGVEMRP